MGRRNFFLTKFFLRLEIWAVLCSFFGFFFILAKSKFGPVEVDKVFILVWFSYVFILTSLAFFSHGVGRFLGMNWLEHEDAYILNTYIVDGHIDPKISSKKLEKLFEILKKEPMVMFWRMFIYSGSVVLLTALTFIYIQVPFFNIVIILIGGFISVIIISLFSIFFTENFFVNKFLRECRKIIKQREIKVEEQIQLFTLENRFNYFVILLFLIVITLLAFISRPSFFLIVLLILGFLLVVVISRMLFYSIYLVFREIESFASEIPIKKKVEYFTGSSFKEVLDLSKNLNRSAKELYESRERREKVRRRLQEKLNELSKWQKLTVGRELKMRDLKKEIKDLKEKLEQAQNLEDKKINNN